MMTLLVGGRDVGWGQGEIECNLIYERRNLIATNPVADYDSSFFQGAVTGWNSSLLTPHHTKTKVTLAGNQILHSCIYGKELNCIYSNIYDVSGIVWNEGIFTDVQILSNQFYSYDFRLTAKLLECGTFSGSIRLAACNNLVNNDQSTYIGSPQISTIYSNGLFGNAAPQNIIFDNYIPPQNFSQFEISVFNGNGIAVNLSEVSVKCNTNSLTDINVNNSGLAYGFSTQQALNSPSFVKYKWDFGDPSNCMAVNTSTSPVPSHTYAVGGTYTVCVDIQDINGCCAQRCEDIVVQSQNCAISNLTHKILIGCPKIKISTLVANGTLLPNKTIGGKIYLSGTLDIDIPYTFEDTEWIIDAASDILVNSSLTLDDSDLEGCTNMWKGISVQANKTLKINNYSKISDAENAIYFYNARIEITDTEINNCITGVTGSSSLTSVNNKIKNVKFKFTPPLLPIYNNQNTSGNDDYVYLYGINIANTAYLPIIGCTFTDIAYGVTLINSRAPVSGSTSFLSPSFLALEGIQIVTGPLSSTVNNCTFSNMRYGSIGIRGTSDKIIGISNVTITSTISEGLPTGILSKCHNCTVNINGTNNITMTKGIGLYSYNSKPKAINMSGTTINISQSGKFIDFNNVDPINRSNIMGNTFIANPLLVDPMYGVYLNVFYSNEFNFIDNTFIDYGSQSAFLVTGSNRCIFRGNQMPDHSRAFVVISSPSNTYCCNYSPLGSVSFRGTCTNTDLNNQTMKNLYLTNADIGKQEDNGNIFDTGSTAALFTEMGGLTIEQMIQINPFRVPTLTLPHRPLQQNISPLEAQQFWFKGNGGISTCASNCGVVIYPDDPQYDDNDDDEILPPIRDCHYLIDSTTHYLDSFVDAYNISPAALFENNGTLAWHISMVYDHLISIYGLDFMADCLPPWLLEFYNNERIAKNLTLLSQQETQQSVSMQAAIASIEASLIGETNDVIIQNKLEEIGSLVDSLSQLDVKIVASRNQRLASFLTRTDNYNPTIIYIVYQRKVWQVNAKIELYGVASITQAEWQNIREIAHSCVMKNGRVVYAAASLLLYINEKVDVENNSCTQQQPSNRTNEDVSKITLIPNPTSGKVRLNGVSPQSLITIRNNQGVIMQKMIVGESQEIDMSPLVNGLYLLEIKNPNTEYISNHRVIKL